MSALRERARSIAREPMVHFLALGAALFALHAAVAPRPADHLEITAAFVDALRAEQRERSGRLPTDAETRGLVERHVGEELLYREALALGLDRGDVIVRRRLVQKMELLARASVREPTDAELAAHLAAHPDRFRAAEAVSFRHVFVSRDRHGAAAAAKADELLAALRGGADPATLGDPFVAGSSFARRTRADLESTFGAPFAEAALAAPLAGWSGPIASTYGLHLVHASARDGTAPPDLAAARARVREDLLTERREGAVRAEIDRLRARYAVHIDGAPR
jgi:peptidyl-prolyl cis-trans isomerase C